VNVTPTAVDGVLILEPRVFGDARGFFFESWNRRAFEAAVGGPVDFVQDNHSRSARGVLVRPQGKLVRVVVGAVFDVAVDIRPLSPTFGRWVGVELSAADKRQLWIPPGLAHGFVVRSESAEVLYKTTDYWCAEHERCIRWDDPALAIDWGLAGPPVVSEKDARGGSFPPPAEPPGA
jgi:dTDP-4-dehydrorhamnose 3,5-epimerase